MTNVGGSLLYENLSCFFNTPHYRPPRCVLIITAYLDESEHSVSHKYMTVAGFVGNDEQWKSLAEQWKNALGRKKALHMNQLRFNSKPDRVRRLLERLGPIPYKCGLTPYAGIVRVADYQDIVAGMRVPKEALSGYVVCLIEIMVALNKLIPAQHSIKVVCEFQRQYEESATKMYRAMTIILSNPAYPYFAGLEFIRKDSTMLTEPSDFLAFAITKNYENATSPTVRLCAPITPTERMMGYLVKREKIRKIMLNLKTHLENKPDSLE